MNAEPVVDQKPKPFLGKHDQVPRFLEHKAVRDCMDWLTANGFRTERDFHFEYLPGVGVEFEVIHSLEDCADQRANLTLPCGIWRCIGRRNGESSCWGEFLSSNGEIMEVRVGYAPHGIHAIMAWKGNIRKV